MSWNKQTWRSKPPILIIMVALIAALSTSMAEGLSPQSQPERAATPVGGTISGAELEDLRVVAQEMNMSLQAAISRYAWNDDFALAVTQIREASPGVLTGAEIIDAGNAWVAFTGSAPVEARDILNAFTSIQSGVSVEIRTNLGFTETELEHAIETVHFELQEAPEVRAASTSFDFATRTISSLVALPDTTPDSVLNALKVRAVNRLKNAGSSVHSIVSVSLLRSNRQEISRSDSNTEHLGGEILRTCTSGFGTISSSGVRGIATAGHCSNSQTDDNADLSYQAEHIGTHGDFQWHTGSESETDDFYVGDSSSTETTRRDVYSVGSPVVGQSLCRNGKATHQNCQQVRKVNVCTRGMCNLVQMGKYLASDGDSGGPVYWGHTAYGLHQGRMWDPFWPFDREVFSRADRIGDALGIAIATL